jgi:pimeloyl-ACP methyl ester carboxylesterase
MIRNKFIHYDGNSLHYAIAGHGEKHLLIFHGFGQDMDVFEFLTRSLGRHYTFYVFDLYFHGRSKWTKDEIPLAKEEWCETIKAFLTENNIKKFQVAGFSLGGKFALSCLECFPEQVERIILIAPDGIKTSFWYSLATYPVLFRKFFKSMIFHPERFLGLARALNKTKLLDNGLIRFAEYQMNSEEKRLRVYYSWVVFRHLKFNLKMLAKKINDNNINVVLIVGRYDNVIKPSNMKRFTSMVTNVRFEILNSGHSGLINQSIPYFIEE